ncbi:MAG: rhomboid family intramembrane serine protease [Pseudomonadota bacterium]
MTQQTAPLTPDQTHAGPLVWGVLILICTPELIIQAADAGWIGSSLWRPLSVQNGAFWPGLLRDWRPNYAAQPWMMFLTYSVLHVGLWHMAGNALALWWLGPQVVAHMGPRGFLTVWTAAAILGGASFALLSPGTVSMVGASGCVFGLMGAVVTYRYVLQNRLWTAIGIFAALVLLHLVALVAQQGGIAWQPHLGGYLAGTVLALWWATDSPPANRASEN